MLFIPLSAMVFSCYKGKKVDLVIHNAKIHVMDDALHLAEAMAIKDGKIVETGPERQIRNKYAAKKEIDAKGRSIYPGFTDVHVNILAYARQKLSVDLNACRSMDELFFRMQKYQSRYHRPFLVGVGWDESFFAKDRVVDNKKLSALFPEIPVCLMHAGGRALLANDAALKRAGIDPKTKIPGGTVVLTPRAVCSGVLQDNAMTPMLQLIPDYPQHELISAIKEIEQELYTFGITNIHQVGIDWEDISFLKKLITAHHVHLNIYAMLHPTNINISFARKFGIYRFKNLLIRSFYIGPNFNACFPKTSRQENGESHLQAMSPVDLKKMPSICEETGYQMNWSAWDFAGHNGLVERYVRIFEQHKDHRWRIEHAQILQPAVVEACAKFGAFPSFITSGLHKDQYFGKNNERKHQKCCTYLCRSLMNHYGMFAVGSGFPIALMDPFSSINALVNQKDTEGIPYAGFHTKERISLNEALKAMTMWAAFASFQENQLGTLEKGKDATFAVFENPILPSNQYKANFSVYTAIKGKIVYSAD